MTAVDTPSGLHGSGDPGGSEGSPASGLGGAFGANGTATKSRKNKRRKVRLIVAGAILVGAFAFLLIQGLTNSLNYFETVNQAVADRAQLGTTTFRLEGLVVPGTIHPTATGVNFAVESSGVREQVIETGQPPQLFQPNIPVVLVGHFAGSFFASDQILVDHTSKYIAQYPARVTAPNGTKR
jgi:cytochrome c-type biogenesis protein CcmE